MLSFKPTFSLSSFTLIKRLFSSSSFSAIRVVSSAYLTLLILLPAIVIPAYASSSPAFCRIYSAYKLNKQGDSVRHLDVLLSQFLCCSISSSNCCFLTCIKVSQEAGQVVCYSYLFKNFPVCCYPHSQRFGVVSKAEVDVFLQLACFFDDPTDVGNLISASSAFYKYIYIIFKIFSEYCISSEFK